MTGSGVGAVGCSSAVIGAASPSFAGLIALFGVAIVELAVQPATTATASTALATAALLTKAIGVGFEGLTVLALFAFVTFFALILKGRVGLDLLGREILGGFFDLILGCLLPIFLALIVGAGFGALVETAAAARPAAAAVAPLVRLLRRGCCHRDRSYGFDDLRNHFRQLFDFVFLSLAFKQAVGFREDPLGVDDGEISSPA